MTEVWPDYPPLLLFAAPFFVLFVALEWWGVSTKVLRGRYEKRDGFASMSMGVGNLISDALLALLSLTFLMWVWKFRLLDWGFGIWAVLGALIAQDFLYYWKHYAAHKIRWFWSAHVVHHSSEHYNLTTALRQPWNSPLTGFFILSSPLVLLGVHPYLLGFVGSINLIYQFWIHTEAIDKMPKWFEAIFNTPSHHRVHHATNPRYLDANFAGIFIVWDRIFGTFVPELDAEDITYGIVKPVGTFNPVKIAFIEMVNIFRDAFARGLTIRERFRYVFAPPGYSHDGSRTGSVDIKQQYIKNHPDQLGTPGLPKSLLEK